MDITQTLADCIEICARQGIEQAILCPGSRNAALIIAFEQNPKITCYSISDERVAAFIALGMALETKKATVIVCTSGTAALNFFPGIAEAFFQEIPLLVLTADRPPEWIDQYDGQTVFQTNPYGKHVKANFNLQPDFKNADVKWFANRVFNDALIQTHTTPRGPVHINIPIREPFYPASGTKSTVSENLRIIQNTELTEQLPVEFIKQLALQITNSAVVWIVVGQQASSKLNNVLKLISRQPNIVIISDILGNITSGIRTVDHIFSSKNKISKPDLLITCGKSLITKRLKIFLRSNSVANHWHVQKTHKIRDPYQSVTRNFAMSEISFFEQLAAVLQPHLIRESVISDQDKRLTQLLSENLISAEFSDLTCVAAVLPLLPEKSVLHLGNSMSVRYANAVNFLMNDEVEVQCNRGTSGIEGSVSTAVGQAICSNRPVFCIVGDVSFLYDKNALWHNYLPRNLKIIVLNNGGGNIFRMIPGPKSQSSYSDFFETKQKHTAEYIATHYKILYRAVNSPSSLNDAISALSKSEPVIIECFTNAEVNERVYKEFLAIN